MDDKLKRAHKSCHHGKLGYENQLKYAQLLTDYDIIEIDFVYYNNQYVSSHDYEEENINKGSLLKNWIDFVIENDKVLWIDLKDDNISVFLPQLSKLNVNALIDTLDKLNYKNLDQFIIISCQYHNIYEQLLNLSSYTIMRDLPKDILYVMDMLIPEFLNYHTKELIITEIENDVGDASIIAIDQQFFTVDELSIFVNQCLAKIIIIYTFESPIILKSDKHIIYQYNY